MLTHLWVECHFSKLGQVEKIHGEGIGQYLSFWQGSIHQIFWRLLRHIGTFVDTLGRCWHTCGQSASAQNLGWVQQIYGGVGRSIYQLLLGPHAPNCWRFKRHIGTFLHQPQVADTPIGWSRSTQHTHISFTITASILFIYHIIE